ncbi:hypothetical protein BCR41DRAFT_365430 [Lobosporangium transversale]|uniref:Uncharacterized protein n=1 Tax=Lobosporangium transversale TaxID=64571 RepID=A0A1Y2G6C2_9FUNG|nr:hypothetical protein BCR41DRAFT_365430 [Lobosporangium transversale]ORY94274.1 hypothetical protein BCR41DRAFT_365430 [Lobosporangium transversale]|eukprot:XP_021875217.1 hypothetical protein BCR41DRAFT_365430 [Lobosporangium transversale]
MQRVIIHGRLEHRDNHVIVISNSIDTDIPVKSHSELMVRLMRTTTFFQQFVELRRPFLFSQCNFQESGFTFFPGLLILRKFFEFLLKISSMIIADSEVQ